MENNGHSPKVRLWLWHNTWAGYIFTLHLKMICYINQQLLVKQVLNKGGYDIKSIIHLDQNKIVKMLWPQVHDILRNPWFLLVTFKEMAQFSLTAAYVGHSDLVSLGHFG